MKIGDLNLTSIKIGNDPVMKIYLGTELVWQSGSEMAGIVNNYEVRVLSDFGKMEDKEALLTFLEE